MRATCARIRRERSSIATGNSSSLWIARRPADAAARGPATGFVPRGSASCVDASRTSTNGGLRAAWFLPRHRLRSSPRKTYFSSASPQRLIRASGRACSSQQKCWSRPWKLGWRSRRSQFTSPRPRSACCLRTAASRSRTDSWQRSCCSESSQRCQRFRARASLLTSGGGLMRVRPLKEWGLSIPGQTIPAEQPFLRESTPEFQSKASLGEHGERWIRLATRA